MSRKFSINCDFGGQLAPFDIFIGQPEQGHHPLHFQADWLLKQRGGTILPEVMDAISKLNTLAQENGVPLEDLCVYALGSAQEETNPDTAATESDEEVLTTTDTMPQAESMVEEGVSVTEITSEMLPPESVELQEVQSSVAEETESLQSFETVENSEPQTSQEETDNKQYNVENK